MHGSPASSRSRILAPAFLAPFLALALVQSFAAPPPHKAWKLVFSDEFEGATLDESRWSRRSSEEAFRWNGAKGIRCDDHAAPDGQGHFVVRVSRDPDGTYRFHPGIETKGKFQQTYGYFETRVRFSRQPGWWGAVWLYGVETGPNPFLMGQEIDIFEDFHKPKSKHDFSHNVHFDAQLDYASEDNKRVGKLDGRTLYRVSRGQAVEVADWDAFHVVGVEWTPLEYAFYCDGKETFRLDYTQVPVTNQPMQLLISGCFRDPNRAKFQGDYAQGVWPDQLTVDYVRVYAEDTGAAGTPMVRLRRQTGAPDGGERFEVSASDRAGPVDRLFLFDNGRLRGELEEAEGTFTVASGQLYDGDNIFIAMARTRDGRTGLSDPLICERQQPLPAPSAPYQQTPQRIPGKILAGRYDEGGPGIAYFSYLKGNVFAKPPWNLGFRPGEGINSPNSSGISASHRRQWVRYTVEVAASQDYAVTPLLARPDAMRAVSSRPDRIELELDGEKVAEFTFSPALTTGRNYWGDYRPLETKTVAMPQGRHVLRVRFDATPFNFGGLLVEPAAGDFPPP